MKFSKKSLLKIGLPIALISPAFVVVSCSHDSKDYSISSNSQMYSNIWNLSLDNTIKNSIFEWTVADLEKSLNNSIKSNQKSDFTMRVYCFYYLWEAIKKPYSPSGSVITNLSSEISDYSNFLSNKLKADNTDVSDSKKTYNKFKKYINSFNYIISLINFDGEVINNQEKLKDVFANGDYKLNFKIDFWSSDSETNSKMVSSKTNKSIMYKNSIDRDQREILNNISDTETKSLVQKQFAYQSTKLYYDIDTKTFSTIILPSNIYNGLVEETPDSGFQSSDSKRQLFAFEWYGTSENSTSFDTYIDFLLDSTNNFDTSLTTDWTNFLKKESLMKDYDGTYKMENIKINLNNTIKYDKNNFD